MTFELLANVPESRELTLRLPPEVPVGPVRVSVSTRPEPLSIHIELGADNRRRVFPKRPTHPKMAAEYDAFEKMLPELLTTHRGVFVTIHEGQIITVARSEVEALTAAHRLQPGVMHYVRLVTDEPQPIERLPSIREVRTHGKRISAPAPTTD